MSACCDTFAYARRPRTDNEGYGRAIHRTTSDEATRDETIGYHIGAIREALNYCPWCGEELYKYNHVKDDRGDG